MRAMEDYKYHEPRLSQSISKMVNYFKVNEEKRSSNLSMNDGIKSDTDAEFQVIQKSFTAKTSQEKSHFQTWKPDGPS